MLRSAFFALLFLCALRASAQRARLDCYRPPAYRDQVVVPKEGLLFGAGLQRPFLLSNAVPLNGFRYAAKLLPQLRVEYRQMLRPWFGLAVAGQLYWENYGLRYDDPNQANEKSLMAATLIKAGLSVVLAPGPRFRVLAGASYCFRDFSATSTSGGAFLNQNSSFANIRYTLDEPNFGHGTFVSIDGGLECALSRRFSLLLNGAYYLSRSLPMGVRLDLYGQNGQESHETRLDGRQLNLGLSLLIRTGRLD